MALSALAHRTSRGAVLVHAGSPAASGLSPRQRKLQAKRRKREEERTVQHSAQGQAPIPTQSPQPSKSDAAVTTRITDQQPQPAGRRVRRSATPPSSASLTRQSVFLPHPSHPAAATLTDLTGADLADLALHWAGEIAGSLERYVKRLHASTAKDDVMDAAACSQLPHAWWRQLTPEQQEHAVANVCALAQEAGARLGIQTLRPDSLHTDSSSPAAGLLHPLARPAVRDAALRAQPLPAAPGLAPELQLSRQQRTDVAWAVAHLAASRHPALCAHAAALHAALRTPFCVVPLAMPGLRLAPFQHEVSLTRDTILLEGGKQVQESRLTGWQSDVGSTFRYSGKEMVPPRGGLTSSIAQVRDSLLSMVGQPYDSVLINLYPDGRAGMRFHADPLYGEWTSETAVVSIGAPRKFVFRDTADHATRWAFTVRNGDVVVMYGDCQDRLQHSIVTDATMVRPRMSLVYKQRVRS